MSLQLPTILSPPTPCTPVLRSLCSPQARSRSCRFPFRVGFRSGLHLTPSRVRQCIRPYRVHHFLNYGLVVRFRLLPTPSLDDAVAFSYGQPVLCPMGTSTPLLVRTFRRTRGVACNSHGFTKDSRIIFYRAPGRCEQRPSSPLSSSVSSISSWLARNEFVAAAFE